MAQQEGLIPHELNELAKEMQEQQANRNIVFRDYSKRNHLTPDLAEALIRAVPNHMYLSEVAASCGVHKRTLAFWVAKGRRANADPFYADFSRRFLAADAQFQAQWVYFAKLCAMRMNPGAIFGFIDRRWPVPKDHASFSDQVEDAPETDVRALLEDPPPEMVSALQEAGTIKHLLPEAVNSPDVQALLKQLGYQKVE